MLLNDAHWAAALSAAVRPESGYTARTRLPDSVLIEEVFVNAFDHVCLLILHTDIVANHQRAKSSAVDQDDSGGHPVRVGGVSGLISWSSLTGFWLRSLVMRAAGMPGAVHDCGESVYLT
jgi:hypothetical protein